MCHNETAGQQWWRENPENSKRGKQTHNFQRGNNETCGEWDTMQWHNWGTKKKNGQLRILYPVKIFFSTVKVK